MIARLKAGTYEAVQQLADVDFSTLKKACGELTDVKGFVISRDGHEKSVAAVMAYYWEDFLRIFQDDEV